MLADMNSTRLSLRDFEATKNWLLRHEQDIALGINDYCDLHELFIAIVGRSPNETNA